MRRLVLLSAILLAVVPAASPAPTRTRIHVPHGYRVETFASGLEHPTALAWGPGGRLYATEDVGSVVSVARGSRSPRTFVGGLDVPLGLAWRGRTLYVSEQGRLEAFGLRGGRRTVVSGLPYGLHQQDNVVFGPDGRLYFGSGSTCDVCRERDRRSAAVLSVRPNGRDLRVVATGTRNPFGLAFQPRTHRLYASVNGQDKLGSAADPEPAETVVLVRPRRWFGWPTCWPSMRRRRLVGSCRGATAPATYLEPHSSADGLAFWRGELYVAEWGQYYSSRAGRVVVRIRLGRGGAAGKVSVFATGFDHPLALATDRHGGLLVADWGSGIVYRIAPR